MRENLLTNSHSDKVPKQEFQCICLSVVLNYLVYRADKKYYPQVFFFKKNK